jgi:hypothetical protein
MFADAVGDAIHPRLVTKEDGEPTGAREREGVELEPARLATAW